MYEDEDTVLSEFEEFYSYVEIPQVAENLRAWQGVFPGGQHFLRHFLSRVDASCLEWIKSSTAQRKAHVQIFLESLEHRDAEVRFKNARCLLYVLQG
jgi:hypothetical protein